MFNSPPSFPFKTPMYAADGGGRSTGSQPAPNLQLSGLTKLEQLVAGYIPENMHPNQILGSKNFGSGNPIRLIKMDIVKELAAEMQRAFLDGDHEMAIARKALNPQLAALIIWLGYRNFEVASGEEIRGCFQPYLELAKQLSADPITPLLGENLLFTNPDRSDADNDKALQEGVKRFIIDSECGLEALKEAENRVGPDFQPDIFIRIMMEKEKNSETGADAELGDRFGVETIEEAVDLILKAHKSGLNVRGLSFHTGTQQKDTNAWHTPLQTCSEIFRRVKEASNGKIVLDSLDIGGGFPSPLNEDIPSLAAFNDRIVDALTTYFGERSKWPAIITEPGRRICGAAGIVLGHVTGAKIRADGRQILTLDVGEKSAALILGVGLKMRVFDPQTGEEIKTDLVRTECYGPAGASLDMPASMYVDMLLARGKSLPLYPRVPRGAVVVFEGAGAYTEATNPWCAFRPPRTHYSIGNHGWWETPRGLVMQPSRELLGHLIQQHS